MMRLESIRHEAKFRIKEEINGFSKRGHEVSWCERDLAIIGETLVKMEQKTF